MGNTGAMSVVKCNCRVPKHDPGVERCDNWICVCGNTKTLYAFYPCNVHGEAVNPLSGAWSGLWICEKCGRIFDPKTSEAVAQRGQSNIHWTIERGGEIVFGYEFASTLAEGIETWLDDYFYQPIRRYHKR